MVFWFRFMNEENVDRVNNLQYVQSRSSSTAASEEDWIKETPLAMNERNKEQDHFSFYQTNYF